MTVKICESCVEFGTSLNGKPSCKKGLKLWKNKCKGHDMLGETVRSILMNICKIYPQNYFSLLVENMENRMESLNTKYPTDMSIKDIRESALGGLYIEIWQVEHGVKMPPFKVDKLKPGEW